MFNTPFYYGTIRKTIVAFGQLFSNIYIERKEGGSVTGTTAQTLHVPLTYAPKEKWLVRIEQDPSLENYTYVTLPRMSFQITGYNYDSSRKLSKMQKIKCHTADGSSEMFSPVPYNISISLYILTKTQEDAMQIIEQILPTFGPEYTLSINAIPDMNVIQDIPITLNDISVEDNYDGDFTDRRFVTHTLTFTLKVNLYGSTRAGAPIYHVNAVNMITTDGGEPSAQFVANADPGTGEVTEEWIEGL